jgi:hypothetical protein
MTHMLNSRADAYCRASAVIRNRLRAGFRVRPFCALLSYGQFELGSMHVGHDFAEDGPCSYCLWSVRKSLHGEA